MSTAVTRDYSLVGPESEEAVAAGLASAKWYTPPMPRSKLKELMRRRLFLVTLDPARDADRPAVLLPRVFFGATQHLGLAEDVLDHRLNSRTVYMNPISGSSIGT